MELKVLIILSFVAVAQCKLISLSCHQIRAFVDGHNNRRLLAARGKIPGQPAASEMKMVVWDDELYAKASKWANKNLHQHNPDRSVSKYTSDNLYVRLSEGVNAAWEREGDRKELGWVLVGKRLTLPSAPPTAGDFDNFQSLSNQSSNRFTAGENLYWYSTTNPNFVLQPDAALASWFEENVNYTFGPLQTSDFDKDYDIGHYTQMVWSDSVYLGCAISQTFRNGWNKFFVVCNYGPSGNYLGEKPYKESSGRSNKLICGTKNKCDHPYGSKCKKLS